MQIILEGILQGLFEWLYQLFLQLVSYAGSALLNVMSTDISYFFQSVPVAEKLLDVFLGIGWGLLLGNFAFQAAKSMLTGIGFEGEDPVELAARTFIFSFFLIFSRHICLLGLNITKGAVDLLGIPDDVTFTPPEASFFPDAGGISCVRFEHDSRRPYGFPVVSAHCGNCACGTENRQYHFTRVGLNPAFNRTRMRDVDNTRSDFEEMNDAIGSGLYMKEEINRNGESFYYMDTLIEVTARDEEVMRRRISQVETLCGAKGMLAKRADYQNAQAFQSFLPLVKLNSDIERKARRNVLTSGAAAAFPFSSFEICDQAGVLLGINLHNSSAVILDIFNAQKYSNANLSIMGMSGAGKTFLIQLLALRLRMQDVQVFILAPVKGFEFRMACEAVGGKYIKLSPGSTECINIMEIRRTSMDADAGMREQKRGDSVLADKIQKLHIFFSLLCPEMTPEKRHLLDAVFIETYKRFGITHDNASLFLNGTALKTMPTLTDLYEVLSEKEGTHSMALALSRFVNGSASALGGPTNVDLSSKYIVLDISEMGKDLLPLGMFLALDFVWDEARKSRITKKMLFLDEIWEIIGAGSNPLAADYALEIFKVIRGYGGGAVSATQDLVDYFALEDGKYGKAILNNCRTKVVLQLEEAEAATVQKYLSLSDEETRQIVRSQRGQGLLCTGNSRISVEFRASQTEYDLITTSREDLIRQMEEFETG